MSLPELTDEVVKTINANTNDFIMLNIANPDMVGHTGNFNAAVQAVEHTDRALGRILEALKQAGGEALIIADHGNIEQMLVDGKPCTTHTSNPIPCIYVGEGQWKLKSGSLADVAPTILRLMELENPKEMTGKPLLEPLQG
jgi:2,3-bisphosphoglycerate-independent phosphoglycerate mutase